MFKRNDILVWHQSEMLYVIHNSEIPNESPKRLPILIPLEGTSLRKLKKIMMLTGEDAPTSSRRAVRSDPHVKKLN